jgi:hypothetical protein
MPATLNDIQAKYGDQVYPLYKDQMHEPYMENDNGIGYKGVVMYDEHEDKVQCSECGKWYKHLAPHIYFKHKKRVEQYKEEHGLYQKTPLCSKNFSIKMSNSATEMVRTGWKSSSRFIKGVGPTIRRKRNKSDVMQYKNSHGLCDAQIASRLVVVREMSGKKKIEDLTSFDLQKYDQNLEAVIRNKYGNWALASKALGLKDVLGEYNDANLIAKLRTFVINRGFIPFSSKLSKYGLGNHHTYTKYFGSWRRAKMMAGLDQLLAEVKA